MDEKDMVGETAPCDFQLSGHQSRCSIGESVAVERCPICRSGRKGLYCSSCVLKDNGLAKRCKFDSLKDGMAELAALARTKQDLSNQIQQLTKRSYQRDAQNNELRRRQGELEKLKQIIAWKTRHNQNKEGKIEAIRSNIKDTSRRVGRLSSRMKTMAEKLEVSKEKMSSKVILKQAVESQLVERKQKLIRAVRDRIFTLDTVDINTSESDDDPVKQELADATSHQFVRGRWSYVQPVDIAVYRFIEATADSSGEWQHIVDYLDKSKGDEPANVLGAMNPVYNEWAVISLASQFAYQIAKILDIHLPYRIYIPRQGIESMSTGEFTNFLAQLNYNIAFLSCSQGIEMMSYDPKKTLVNLYSLVSRDDIGRCQPFTLTSTSLLQSIERDITDAYIDEQLIEGDRGQCDDEDDWSIVTESLPMPMPDASVTESVSYTAAASELMTSAVSVMSSLWPFKQS